MKKDLISLKDLSAAEINKIFALTESIKNSPKKYATCLKGKSLCLVFQKPSNRTRVSFEVGMYELGGYSLYLGPGEINLGVREPVKDAAKTLSRYVDGIVLRTFEHKNLLEMAKHSTAPVINGLTDFSHPCQGLADIYTIKEKFKKFKGVNLAYLGDGNNVCHSLLYGCAKVGINISVAAPQGYQPDETAVKESKAFAKATNAKINLTNNPEEAVKDADVIYTDVWASMGEEDEAEQRKEIFKDYKIDSQLMAKAKKNCLFMHCLPAHRGQEVTDEVIDSENSIVFDQAENRLHVQKAILLLLLR